MSTPGIANAYVVTASFSIDADVASFDGAAFRARLASLQVGVSASDIQLTVSSGSIIVVARIAAPSAASAQGLVGTLQSTSSADLSDVLNVPVQSVLNVEAASARPPSSATAQDLTPSLVVNGSSSALSNDNSAAVETGLLLTAVVVLAALLLVTLVVIVCICYLSGRIFGAEARMIRLPSFRRRAPKPRMVKVHGMASRAPSGFGLDDDEIDAFNSSNADATGESSIEMKDNRHI